ncbi:MAG: VIT1/CCC1 transporter family protein [Candidatus Bathyarchaeia archaeon]
MDEGKIVWSRLKNGGFETILKKIEKYMEDPDVAEIARRYFVMNAFDGALMMMGIVMGTYIAGEMESRVIISAGLGASLAMGISGAFGAYMVERAERIRELKELKERVTLSSKRTKVYRAMALRESLFLALVDALSPALAALLSVTPFFLSLNRLISLENAVIISTALTMATLFLLGAFLGKTARESVLIHGLIVVLAGIVTFLFCLLLPF